MKEKTLEDFIKEKASEITGLPIESMFMDENLDKDTRNWIDICTRYANHVKAISLQEFKDEVITQIDHAKDNFPSHSFDPEFTRGITKGFQMASAIVNTKPTTPK